MNNLLFWENTSTSKVTEFPWSSSGFEELTRDIFNSAITSVNPDIPLEIETNASDQIIAVTLRQFERPLPLFFSTEIWGQIFTCRKRGLCHSRNAKNGGIS